MHENEADSFVEQGKHIKQVDLIDQFIDSMANSLFGEDLLEDYRC